MQVLQGIAASPGLCAGEALVIDDRGPRIRRRFIGRDSVDSELDRLRDAIKGAGAEVARHRDAVTRQLGAQYGGIFSAHLAMLDDPQLLAELDRLVREQHNSAEHAITKTLRRYANVFRQLQTSHEHDLVDLEQGLLRQLLGPGRTPLKRLSSPVVVLAHNLTPSETAGFAPGVVLGFATEVGGAGGHTAIVARGLEIPAVVGLGSFLADVPDSSWVIVDGDAGQMIINPDEATREDYRRRSAERRTQVAVLERLRDEPAETQDGVSIELFANIEFPGEVAACVQRGAAGIGLYRTEFLYLQAEREPTEEDHFTAYSQVVQELRGRPVVIRTMDLGADKLWERRSGAASGGRPEGERREAAAGEPGRTGEPEPNPCLGLRSIRLALRHVGLFRTQLRAILRASALGPVWVMFPMIASLQELRRARLILADAMDDLRDANQSFDRELRVGMMVEVPAAVLLIERFLGEVDFISVGTNDLVQYTLAVDRGNSQVADLFRSSDPAVLRLVSMAIAAADTAGKPVAVCGQMSAEPLYTMLLLGLGLRRLSAPPAAIPALKQVCRSVTLDRCRDVAKRALTLDTATQVDSFLREELRRAVRAA